MGRKGPAYTALRTAQERSGPDRSDYRPQSPTVEANLRRRIQRMEHEREVQRRA